jgi:glucose-1-phosphate adenylyltransferase
VQAGAVVRNSVVFADCVVERDAVVDWAVVDDGCRVTAGSVVGRPDARALEDPDEVTIVGRDSRVSQDLAQGARLEPGTS